MIFGGTLRRRRVELGLTEGEVAKRLLSSPSKISRLENGLHDFKEVDVQHLLDIYGIVDPDGRHRLLELARKANEPGWWDAWSDVSTKSLRTYVSLETMAQRIRSYEIGQLLGLLQTADYTRALVRANSPEKNQQEIDRIVELRETRYQRFMADSAANLVCVLDEVTLVRGYGSREIMRRQLDHLISLSNHPRITFRMVELARLNMPVQIGSTTIFDFADGQLPDIVYIERSNGSLYLHDEKEVDEHVKGFDRLQVAALGPQASVRRLQDHRKKP